MDRYDNAMEMLDRAGRIDPTSVKVWNNLAIAFFLRGDKAAARNVRTLPSFDCLFDEHLDARDVLH